MATVSSNFPEIQKVLDQIGDTLDFTRPGRQQSLGRDCLATVVVAIEDRCRAEEAPGGADWGPNKDWALHNPQKQGKPVGVLGDTDNMLSPANLAGEQTITREDAGAVYGIDEASKQKAQWFTEGNEHQVARPFYELDAKTDEALDQFLDGEIDRYLGSF